MEVLKKMVLGKGAKTQFGTVLVWIVILGVIAYVFNFGGFQGKVNDFLGTGEAGEEDATGVTPEALKNCPTDGTSTFTLNVQDELTSSATNVDAEYYIFNGNKLIKEGTTGTDGTVDVDVACGKDYKLLLLNTTSNTGRYSKILDMKARIAEDTINAQLVEFGQINILGIENPADPSRNANVSLPAGATKNFELKFTANETEGGYNKPILMCEALVSNITDINIGSFSDGTPVKELTSLPKRISASSGEQYYAFEYGKMLTPGSGVVSANGNLVASSSATASTTADMTCRIVDQATWKSTDYKVATSVNEGFPTGPENTESLANVGGPDSNAVSYSFIHASGY
jgi:hypothetical protein